jgi:ATP-binding cassette subfamily F protein 3
MFLENVVEETILIRNCSLTYFDEINQKKEARKNEKQREAMAKKKEHVSWFFEIAQGCELLMSAWQIEASIQKGKETAKKTGDENRLRMVKSRQKKYVSRHPVRLS